MLSLDPCERVKYTESEQLAKLGIEKNTKVFSGPTAEQVESSGFKSIVVMPNTQPVEN